MLSQASFSSWAAPQLVYPAHTETLEAVGAVAATTAGFKLAPMTRLSGILSGPMAREREREKERERQLSLELEDAAATRIQSLFRGYQVRRKLREEIAGPHVLAKRSQWAPLIAETSGQMGAGADDGEDDFGEVLLALASAGRGCIGPAFVQHLSFHRQEQSCRAALAEGSSTPPS